MRNNFEIQKNNEINFEFSAQEMELFTRVMDMYSDIYEKFYITPEQEALFLKECGLDVRDTSNLGKIIIISGPSGVGKDTIIREIISRELSIKKVVSVTTRSKREGEVDGVDYHYISREEFNFLAQCRLFLDRLDFVSNSYAVPKAALLDRADKEALIINAVPKTAEIIKRQIPNAKSIIILPPSEQEQYNRLKNRNTESEEVILQRIKDDKEIFRDYESISDYTIISEDGISGIENAIEKIKRFIDIKSSPKDT